MTVKQRDFAKTKETLIQFMNALLDDLGNNTIISEDAKDAEPVTTEPTRPLLNEEAAQYLCTTERNLAVLRKYELIKYAKCGKRFIYQREWLDQFLNEWAGYDLSNEANIKFAIHSKAWKEKHEK